jgi:hypothetical protein
MLKNAVRSVVPILFLAATSCAHYQIVTVPPEVDLARFGTIGIIDFASHSSGPGLSAFATQKFLQQVTQAQPGVRLLPLGTLSEALASVGHSNLDSSAVKALATKFGVQAIIAGNLEFQKQTSVGLSMSSFGVSADVNGTLGATLYDALSGAILWTRTEAGRQHQAGMSVEPGAVGIEATDNAYTRMVQEMSFHITDPFRPHSVEQRI